jgi:hypothetical protein
VAGMATPRDPRPGVPRAVGCRTVRGFPPRCIPPTSRWSEPRNVQRGISRTRCRRSGFGSADESGSGSCRAARTAEGTTEPTNRSSTRPPRRRRRTRTVVLATRRPLCPLGRDGHSRTPSRALPAASTPPARDPDRTRAPVSAHDPLRRLRRPLLALPGLLPRARLLRRSLPTRGIPTHPTRRQRAAPRLPGGKARRARPTAGAPSASARPPHGRHGSRFQPAYAPRHRARAGDRRGQRVRTGGPCGDIHP